MTYSSMFAKNVAASQLSCGRRVPFEQLRDFVRSGPVVVLRLFQWEFEAPPHGDLLAKLPRMVRGAKLGHLYIGDLPYPAWAEPILGGPPKSGFYIWADGTLCGFDKGEPDPKSTGNLTLDVFNKLATASEYAKQQNAVALLERIDRIVQKHATAKPPLQVEETPTDDYALLRVTVNSVRDDVFAAFRQRMNENTVDKLQQMSPEIRAFAETRMKEINTAFDRIKKARGW